MSALLVLHDIGDPDAGARWQDLVAAWPGPALAPNLPGHRETPPPIGAAYALADAAIYAWRAAEDAGIAGDVIVLGHASSGFAAEILAAGGRASRLVLVDGLGPPWDTVDEVVADQHRFLRELLADPEALAPPTKVPDPRLAHRFASVWEREFIRNLRRSISVPVHAIETPASITPDPEERLADYAGPTALAKVGALDAVTADLLQA